MTTSPTLLEQLKEMTKVVADTGDFLSIEKFRPHDATTNPSLVQAAAQMPEYAELVDEALAWARQHHGAASQAAQATAALDQLAVEFGLRILKIIPGRVSTEVDARLSFDTAATIAKAHSIIAKYAERGQDRERILIKIASTWEGIRAAEQLEKEGIHCNLTLLFGIHQAVACAEAGVTLISPFVGRILDWYLKSEGRASYPPAEDPGVRSVTEIFHYYKHFGYKTEVMGASFRNIAEITELAGCDLLTIAPKLLKELAETRGPLPRKLDPAHSRQLNIPRIPVTQDGFQAMHEENRMAKDKLAQGIADFSKAVVAVEEVLAARLRQSA
ncbi:MAG TPA: transaldolase [Pseudomonadota bacterium]|nr:transaldolase [Pseudomonadota bacterium]